MGCAYSEAEIKPIRRRGTVKSGLETESKRIFNCEMC